jgi:hypothetical protein
MRPEETYFEACWYGFDLGDYRPSDGTYESYASHTLPSLPEEIFEGTFTWLTKSTIVDGADPADIAQAWLEQRNQFVERITYCLPKLVAYAEIQGVVLPEAFLRFYTQPKHFAFINSCTGCYFDIPETLVPPQQPGQGYFLPFYHDSQGCLHWYLYLVKNGGHCVVATGVPIGEDLLPFDPPDANEINFCAESFEEFVYRIWIENRIWHQLSERNEPLIGELLAYAEASRSTVLLSQV